MPPLPQLGTAASYTSQAPKDTVCECIVNGKMLFPNEGSFLLFADVPSLEEPSEE